MKDFVTGFVDDFHTIVNLMLIAFPRLFGCRKVVFNDIGAERSLQALRNLKATPRWEFHTPCDELSNYGYQVGNRLVVLIVEEWEPVRMVAPDFLIKKFRLALEAGGQDIYKG